MSTHCHLLFALSTLSFSWAALADCVEPVQGRIIEIRAKACERIVAEEHDEVRKHAGPLFKTWNLKDAYTGALITDQSRVVWMYPSRNPNSCGKFPIGKPVELRAYNVCCDTGRWGKCVFGGNFLGDIDGKPFNTFQ